VAGVVVNANFGNAIGTSEIGNPLQKRLEARRQPEPPNAENIKK
jgi:hypothetical protein